MASKITSTSYWQVFRLIFVLFSLYLMGAVFYRWDGFRYYASFYEFVPSVALVTILWSIVAALTAMLIWLPLRVLEWLCLRIRWKVRVENIRVFYWLFLLFGILVWTGKRLIWPDVQTALKLKLIVFLFVVCFWLFITWRFLDKCKQWMGIIQQRITPLVWLFAVCFLLSVPIVIYHTWIKQADKVVFQEDSRSVVADKDKPNIILVTFDVLTARDMSTYGYHRPTTPFISEWAKTSSLFTRLQAESNFTTPATASLMTGKRLWTHQTYHLRGSKPVKSNIENLPLVLKKNGYYTMAFVANPVASVNVLGIANSFDIAPPATEFRTRTSFSIFSIMGITLRLREIFYDKILQYNWIIRKVSFLSGFLKITEGEVSQDFSVTDRPPEKAFNRFLSVIDINLQEPFFAWIHIYPPHDPYLPSEPYVGMFDSSPELRTSKQQKKAIRMVKDELKNQGSLKGVQPIVGRLRDRYNEFIRYCDKQFEDFIEQLTIRKTLKNTIIILSSDHGESFEHNYFGHNGPHFYEQLTHIPLIIKEPNQTEGRIVNDLTEQIDITSTILDLAGIPVPLWMEGRSLVPLMRDKRLPLRPAFSMNFERNRSLGHQITTGTIAVWEGDYKLIYYLEEKKSLLFNLKHDPDELNNLFDKEPVKGQRLLSLILENLRKANEKISRGE